MYQKIEKWHEIGSARWVFHLLVQQAANSRKFSTCTESYSPSSVSLWRADKFYGCFGRSRKED